LTEKGVDFETVHYMEKRLSGGELKELLRIAKLKPEEVLRPKESAYREHVAGKQLSERELIEVIVKYPELMQRPIVVRGKKAVLARPVDNLRELGIK
jgi:arsenate reductase